MMSPSARVRRCPECSFEFALSESRCIHCGRPSYFPNVEAASTPEELAALGARYDSVKDLCVTRGTTTQLESLERVAKGTRAVIARQFREVERLAGNEREIYATYYQLIEGGTRQSDTNRWDPLRRVADAAFFPGYEEQIRFASLCLEPAGLRNYGEAHFALREAMIAHRTSVLEENSVTFLKHHDVRMADADQLPAGYRAPWTDRHRLVAAKLGAMLTPTMREADFASLLLRPGSSTADDDFVEVHLCGPLTIRTIEHVVLFPSQEKIKRSKNQERLLKEKLERYGVGMEVRQ